MECVIFNTLLSNIKIKIKNVQIQIMQFQIKEKNMEMDNPALTMIIDSLEMTNLEKSNSSFFLFIIVAFLKL